MPIVIVPHPVHISTFVFTVTVLIWFLHFRKLIAVNHNVIFAGNTKAKETNSSKSNDDTEKNAKKPVNDDAVKSGKGTPLGEIPKIEKFINTTRVDGLQPFYQVREKLRSIRIRFEFWFLFLFV